MSRKVVMALGAVLAFVTVVGPASAQVLQGTVVQVDPIKGVIVLDGGRVFNVTPGTQVLVGGQPVRLDTIQPGTMIMVQSAPAAPAPSAPAVTIPPAPGTTVVTAPGATVVSAPAGTRQTVHGVVTDVDRDGEITIKSNDGDEFEVKLSPTTAASVRKGDVVTLDLTFQPNSPAASPRLR